VKILLSLHLEHPFLNFQKVVVLHHSILVIKRKKKEKKVLAPVLGLYPTKEGMKLGQNSTAKIAVFGDSSCLEDDADKRNPCYWMFEKILQFVERGSIDSWLPVGKPLEEPFKSEQSKMPLRLEGNDLFKYSKVIGQTATCRRMNFKRYNRTEGEVLEIVWEELAAPTTQRSNGMLREGTAIRSIDTSQFVRRSLGGILLPYFIGCVVVVFVVAITVKTRRDRLVGKRPQSV